MAPKQVFGEDVVTIASMEQRLVMIELESRLGGTLI